MYEPEYDNHTITQSLEMGSMRKPLRSESESVKKEREVKEWEQQLMERPHRL